MRRPSLASAVFAATFLSLVLLGPLPTPYVCAVVLLGFVLLALKEPRS